MLKKLMTIILVVELGLLYLPEKYIFASEDDPQVATEETTSEEPTIPTIPEMSGIEDTTTPTEIEPITDMIPEDTPVEEVVPVEETAPVEPVNQPAESTNTIAPQNDLPTEDRWFIFNQDTNTITGYSASTEAPKNINIPSTIGGIPVYNIGDSAFAGQQLTGLTLPNGLKTIGNNAFENNSNIIGELIIPDSVTSMGSNTFQKCSGLSSVTIGNSVTSIGDYAFERCSGLTRVTIGNRVSIIGKYAFYFCSGLTNVTMGNSVTTISYNAFAHCSSLTSIVISNSVISIGQAAFEECRRLASVTMGTSVTDIGYRAFESCSSLTSVTIPKSVTTIGTDAFSSCDALTSINIPDKNEGEISGAPWSYSFSKHAVFWKDVKDVGDYAFSITTNAINKYIGKTTTANIPSTFTVDGISYPVKAIGKSAFTMRTDITDITIPNGVTSIGSEAFFACFGITSIIIPESVSSIGINAFSECEELKIINIPGKSEGEISGAPWGCEGAILLWKGVEQIGEYLFNTATNTILKYTGTATILDVPSAFIVNGISYPVKNIGYKAFYVCSLQNVTIPDCVTSIGNNAFGYSSLRNITIGNGVTSIGKEAFDFCVSLTSVTIGNAVTSIGDSAFAFCKGLTSIVIPNSVTSIGKSAFNSCEALTRIDIPGKNEGEIIGSDWGAPISMNVYWKDTKQIGDYLFSTTKGTINNYTGTTITVSIPSSFTVNDVNYPVKRIGNWAFLGNKTITSVTIPNSVIYIGNSSFSNCDSLTSVTIGNSVTSIRDSAFYNCNSLTSVTIPNSVIYIENSSFSSCDSLTSVTIGNGVTSIGQDAFSHCKGLTSIVIPNSVTTISINAFAYCRGLTNVTIGNSVTSIRYTAFYECSSLIRIDIPSKNEGDIYGAPWGAPNTTVVYWKGVKQIGDYAFDFSKNSLVKYLGNDPVVTIPSYLSVDDTDYPVKAILDNAFYGKQTITNVTIPDSVTSIGESVFYGCSGLTSIVIPDSVTSIGSEAFNGCNSLNQAVISKNLNSMRNDVFNNTPALQTIYMRASRAGLPSSITSAQPWGAPATSTVWYGGDIITFDHSVRKVTGQYNRILDIRAFVNKPAMINRIILPNGTIKYIGKSDWPDETGYYPYGSITEEAITANGTFVFKGYGDDNVERSYTVEINDIGSITLRANEASITEQVAATASEQDVLDLLNVSAEDEVGVLTNGTDCTIWISPEDMNKIHALHLGDVTTIRVNVKSSRSGKEMTSYRDVTLNTTSCVIHADNVDLWPIQSKVINKQELIGLMNASVVDSEGVADMTKLDIADEDFNKIKIGTPGIYNVMLTYDTNKSKKRVRVTIMDDSPAVMVKIPSEIKMKKISNDTVYGVGAEETVSIQSFVNTTLYPNPFKIETNPSFWLESTAPDAAWINRMKVVVLDANNQPLPDNHLLATLSGSTIQSAPFKLRGYHNKWNSKGAYSGIMTFTITYEELTP